ncbi:putative Tigger transposable element-derived protein 1-like 225 [Homarus americanus]|uniref:Putative Tigger transposable element-derived protein 1-like 225 n=1 Tax=Homarus americanus TaxID=6706 RepID=A0A8J5MWY9_HOMAM|nr:putative Tigger transposable element-derived protein 1-like 225 [Homarus americanus]
MNLARQAGCDELESEDIEDVLASHTEELTNEDLQQLTEHSPVEDEDDEEEPQRPLTSKKMAESFNMFQQAMQILVDDNPNRERKSRMSAVDKKQKLDAKKDRQDGTGRPGQEQLTADKRQRVYL